MHKPLLPDVTLYVPHWWQLGMPLLPLADHMAPVPLKRKRDMSAEPKTDPAKRAYIQIRAHQTLDTAVSPAAIMEARGDLHPPASSTCAIASESHRIAYGTWTRQLCAWFQQASAGGPQKPRQPMSSPRAPSSRSRSLHT